MIVIAAMMNFYRLKNGFKYSKLHNAIQNGADIREGILKVNLKDLNPNQIFEKFVDDRVLQVYVFSRCNRCCRNM